MDSEERTMGCIGLGVFAVIFVVILFFMSLTRVNAGFVGVITRWGAVSRVVYPGISWKIPIAEGVKKIDTRTLKDQVDASAASRDLQLVTSTIAVNYHLDGKYATEIYQNVGLKYQDIVIAPAIQETWKATTALYTAEQLLTQRNQVSNDALNALGDKLLKYHIIVENFNIVNFDFSQEFNDAIEAKQVAQQQVATARQLLEKTKVEAQTAVAQAQGQADAQAALKETGALTPEYLNYLALNKWNGILPVVVGDSTPFVDVTEFTK